MTDFVAIDWPEEPKAAPQWTDGNEAARVEPLADEKRMGWSYLQRPPFEYMNWILYNLGTVWREYFNNVVIRLRLLHSQVRIVSKQVGGENLQTCFQTLRDGDQVFIRDWDEPLTSPLAITKNNIQVSMAPSAFLTGNITAAGAKNVTFVIGNDQPTQFGIRILGGRYLNFDYVVYHSQKAKWCYFGGGIRFNVKQDTIVQTDADDGDATRNRTDPGINERGTT